MSDNDGDFEDVWSGLALMAGSFVVALVLWMIHPLLCIAAAVAVYFMTS